ncbi:hypothetical protein [Streptomyces sp. NPDC017890]|uniref:hypothetical protein n=1 Tax=Streptomyces sp. NPDC017890 TaxID=3365015 RepID=UPI0037BD0CA5
MSTEARRASLPSRPSTAPRSDTLPDTDPPPRPDAPPRPAADALPAADAHPRTPARPDAPPRPAAPPHPAVPPRPAQAPGAPGADTTEADQRPPGTSAHTTGRPARVPRPNTGAASAEDADTVAGRRPATGEGPAHGHGVRRLTDTSDDRASSEGGGTGSAPPPYPRFRVARSHGTDPAPPPPCASARFPDAPPTVGHAAPGGSGTPRADHAAVTPARRTGALAGSPPSDAAPGAVPPQRPAGPPARHPGVPAQTPSETTRRLRPIPPEPGPEPEQRPDTDPELKQETETDPEPKWERERVRMSRPAAQPAEGSVGAPDPALSWSAPPAPGGGRPRVSFAEPEGYDGLARPRPLGGRLRPQAVAAAVCLVLGTGLLTGAVTGSWLAGDSGDGGARTAFTEAGELWHSVPVDRLFPPTVQGQGAGPGGADRTWTRVAVAPDSDCAGAFDPLLAKVLDPVGCRRLLRATYTDATQSHVTTVGLLFAKADAAAMTSLAGRFEKEGLGRRADLMPLPYAAKDTVAAGFRAQQRASWTVSVLTDAPVVVYAVSGWADNRTVDEPEPAEEAMESGATSAPAEAGLGHEAQGLADRVERALRKNVGPATEHPS